MEAVRLTEPSYTDCATRRDDLSLICGEGGGESVTER